MAVGFLPVLLLQHNFRVFVGCRESRRLIRLHPGLAEFVQYLEDTYISENALFGRDVWCVYGRHMANRSNNAVEGKN